MPANMKDVSRLAGVSVATVSRVINHAPNVSADIQKRVNDAIQKLNYEPNKLAQSLSGSAFQAIGIAAGRVANYEYTGQVLRAISAVAEQNGYQILLNYSDTPDAELEKCISMVKSKMVRGMILLGSKTDDILIEKLFESQTPFVVIGRVENERLCDKVYTVDTDNFQDCKAATQFLIQHGHRKIACLHSRLCYVGTKDRLDGFIAAHAEYGIPVDYTFIAECGHTMDDARKVCFDIFNRDNRPTAILATDDVKGYGVYSAAMALNLKIPDHISIVGHNNYDFSRLTVPAMTTIEVPIQDLGVTATNIFLKQVEKKLPPIRTVLPTRFIVRDSTNAHK